MPDEKDLHDPRNPVYDNFIQENIDTPLDDIPEFHECSQCNCRCCCKDIPCSCCDWSIKDDGQPVVSPEFEKRKTIEALIKHGTD